MPLPVSVVGAKTQERERLERIQDFAQKVPNFVPSITNPRTSAMSICGISGISGGADGSELAVGLIVDNVFYTHVGFQWADFVDLQSFEVARGPHDAVGEEHDGRRGGHPHAIAVFHALGVVRDIVRESQPHY